MMNSLICRAIITVLTVSMLGVTACSDSTNKHAEASKVETAVSNFVGCYTIEQGSPATIKIDKDGVGYTMQMKEGADKAQAWDTPEPLEPIGGDDAWQYFSSNSLDLGKADLIGDAIIRQDKMLAMAQVQPVTANTNPFIDSLYVVMLINKVATIYQVPCDDTRVDAVKNFHDGVPVAPQSQ